MLKKIVIAFGMRTLGALATFLMTVVISRQLTIQEAGYFLLGFTLITIFIQANQFGCNQASLRYIGASYADKNWEVLQQTANATKLIVLSATLISIAFLWYSAPWITNELWHKPQMQSILQSSCFVILPMSLSLLLGHHFQAIGYTSLSISILQIIVPIGVIILTLYIGYSSALQAIKGLQVLSFVNLLIAGSLWLYITPHNTYKIPSLKSLLVTCFPLWIICIMSILTNWGGQIIAGSWASSEDIARFAAAQRSAMLISFVLIAFNMVIAPRFAALYSQKKYKEFKELAISTTKWMTLFSLPVAISLIFYSGFIMSLFGEEFRTGKSLLIILAIGQIVNAVTGSVAYILNMSGHEKDMRNIVLISGPITILLALTLTPIFGITGAAIATSIGISCQNLGAAWMVKKRLGFNVLLIWGKTN